MMTSHVIERNLQIIVPFPIMVEFGITMSGWIRVVSSNPLTINLSYNVLLIAGSPIAIQNSISLALNSFKISENFLVYEHFQ